MSMDAKWYAEWVRLLPASTADEKMRNLEAADMLEELDERIQQLEQRVPRWISVEERLPERGERVICWCEIMRTGERYFTVGSRWGRNEEWWLDSDPEHDCEERVTHWMLMPDPPEEEEEREGVKKKPLKPLHGALPNLGYERMLHETHNHRL